MMRCEWQQSRESRTGRRRCRCRWCGRVVEILDEKKNVEETLLAQPACGKSGRNSDHREEATQAGRPPSLPRKALRYGRTVKRWIAAGRPERSDEEVSHVYETLCRPCNQFDGKSCRICGCRIRRSGKALTNKIRMATEHCPIEKW